jgi:hypothetical protein
MVISPGFIGYADIGSTIIRCSDFNVNLKQEPIFYDHIIGLRDTIPTDIYTIKGDGGDKAADEQYNNQNILWRPSVKISQGGFSYPWMDNNIGLLWEEVRGGKSFDMSFKYTCGVARKFTGCKINTYSIKISSGDFISSSVDIMARHEELTMIPDTSIIDTSNKILTWDTVKIFIDNAEATNLVSFDLTINNSCIPIYTAGSNSNITNPLEAKDIRVGIQKLTGTITSYEENSLDYLESVDTEKNISLEFDGQAFVINLTAIFHPMTVPASIGPVIRTIPFTGVNYNILV